MKYLGQKRKPHTNYPTFLGVRREEAKRPQQFQKIVQNLHRERRHFPKFGDVPKSKQIDRTPGLSATQSSPHELRQ